jgi:hypothetical protein
MPFTAFQPSGTTKLVAASSSTASTATQVSTGSQQGMFVSNPSSVPVYVAAGTSDVQAACPTTALPCVGLCIPPGRALPLATPPSGWLSAATSGGDASIFATPGFYG